MVPLLKLCIDADADDIFKILEYCSWCNSGAGGSSGNFVCTPSVIMMLMTGCYNVQNPAGGFLYEGLPGVEEPVFDPDALEIPNVSNVWKKQK